MRPHLQRAGIGEYLGKRVILIAPFDAAWYANLAEAIQRETGHYPLLVQTEAQREAFDCPGPLRMIDMEAYMTGDDGETRPPWFDDGGLLPDL